MKLILEETFDLDNVIELNESSGQKTYVIKGTFSTPDKKNRNGRIYATKLWEDTVDLYQKEIAAKTSNTLMEKEHPQRNTVDPWKAVAQIRKLEMREGVVYGEAELLNIPETMVMRALIDKGVKIGVSSRGVGKLVGDIVEEFHLTTYDIVSTPSDYNANLTGFNESMLLESVDYQIDSKGKWVCTPKGCTMVAESKENLAEGQGFNVPIKPVITKGIYKSINRAIKVASELDSEKYASERYINMMNDIKDQVADLTGTSRIDETLIDMLEAKDVTCPSCQASGVSFIVEKGDLKLKCNECDTFSSVNEIEKQIIEDADEDKDEHGEDKDEHGEDCECPECKKKNDTDNTAEKTGTKDIDEASTEKSCGCKAKELSEAFEKFANKAETDAHIKEEADLKAKFDSYMNITELFKSFTRNFTDDEQKLLNTVVEKFKGSKLTEKDYEFLGFRADYIQTLDIKSKQAEKLLEKISGGINITKMNDRKDS